SLSLSIDFVVFLEDRAPATARRILDIGEIEDPPIGQMEGPRLAHQAFGAASLEVYRLPTQGRVLDNVLPIQFPGCFRIRTPNLIDSVDGPQALLSVKFRLKATTRTPVR